MTLAHFDLNKNTVIQVKASLLGLGAVILQDGSILFASKALTDAETPYANIKREMLAVVYACEKYHKCV